MSYISRKGRRPQEYASKASHSDIINDKSVKIFLDKCNLPKTADEVNFDIINSVHVENIKTNPIKYFIAIDGGYSEVSVKKSFPSSQITFFQFGALIFSVSDLENLSQKPFIDPEDIAKLKDIQKLEFVLPTKNIILSKYSSLIESVRYSLYEFFINTPQSDKFIETLKWFVFQEYDKSSSYSLANCPLCHTSNVLLELKHMKNGYVFPCRFCGGDILLTDVFRLHEAIDNQLGAGGILGYLTNLLEQVILIHLIRLILDTKPNLMKEILFIKDGPLAFFGQTANMHQLMRKLIIYLHKNHDLFLAGLDKSGSFVEHADEIENLIKPDNILLINNEYIYKYIIPGEPNRAQPYGGTSYYSIKIIYKAKDGRLYVVTLPVHDKNIILSPVKSDIKNIDIILTNIAKLKCDMYDNALIPIALVNKLVSLSNHPSSMILEKFARKHI